MRNFPEMVVLLALVAMTSGAAAQPVLGGAGGGNSNPASAPGPSGAIQKITPQGLASLIGQITVDNKPIQTSISTFKDGTSIVVTPMWGPNIYSGVSMQYCEKDGSGCHWLQFFANLGAQKTVDLNWMNAFNQHFLGAKAYTLASGQLVIQQDMSLWPGVSPSEIGWYLEFFKNVVDDSANFKPQ